MTRDELITNIKKATDQIRLYGFFKPGMDGYGALCLLEDIATALREPAPSLPLPDREGWQKCYRVCLEKDKAIGFLCHSLRISTQQTRDAAWKQTMLAMVEEISALIPDEPPPALEPKEKP